MYVYILYIYVHHLIKPVLQMTSIFANHLPTLFVAQEMPGKTWADGHWLGSCLHLADGCRELPPSRGPTALEGGIPEAQGQAEPWTTVMGPVRDSEATKKARIFMGCSIP